jgi:hypothetical protein
MGSISPPPPHTHARTRTHRHRQTHRHRDTDTHTQRQTDRHTHTDRQTHTQTDRHTHRQADRQTDTDTESYIYYTLNCIPYSICHEKQWTQNEQGIERDRVKLKSKGNQTFVATDKYLVERFKHLENVTLLKVVTWNEDDATAHDPLRMLNTDLTFSQLITVCTHLITKECLDRN